ncbi:MAG TPA: hypothetical protein VEX68_11885 [Bryobacteraceae bacterium]|nr:hypothetical protein [Bryobacteraceae bacterium]
MLLRIVIVTLALFTSCSTQAEYIDLEVGWQVRPEKQQASR